MMNHEFILTNLLQSKNRSLRWERFLFDPPNLQVSIRAPASGANFYSYRSLPHGSAD